MNNLYKTLLCSLSLCAMLSVSLPQTAAAFDLFNQDRGKAPEPPPPPPQPPTPPPPKPKPTKPKPPPPPQTDFGLQGTSQLGDRFRAVLITPKNQVRKINWRAGSQPVDLGGGFRLLEIKARQAVIQYPPNSPCREDRWHKGVDCRPDGKTAVLRLVLGKVTPDTSVAPPVVVHPAAVQGARGVSDADVAAQQAARERAQKVFQQAAQRAGNNIQPNEVPPGMRVVKTPFGDRLVPIKR